MRLQIIIPRLSNFLFFIQKTDKQILTGFDLKNYFPSENFDLLFYEKSNDKIWEQIEKGTGKERLKQFQKSIKPLETTFNPYWRKEAKHLLSCKKYFQSNELLLQRVIIDMKRLSGTQHFTFTHIPIYFISDFTHSDDEIHAWFSWMPKKSFMVVEIPPYFEPRDDLFPIGVLAHEFFHLILRKNKNLFSRIGKVAEDNKKLFIKLSEGMPHKLFLEELLISSFIPEGYLSRKHFHTKITRRVTKPKSLLAWRKFVAFKLRQAAKVYVDNLHHIDEKYLKDLIKVIKENTKK
ncbi:MAG: hypothetical protein AAB585_00085 [Patescibacteria group bacterium]